MSRTAFLAACVGVVIGLGVAAPAHAQQAPGDKAAAEALFGEGKRLLQDGKFAEACPKLAESQRIDPAVGTLLHLGECYAQNGQTASAWAAFRSAESMARNAHQAEREKTAHDRAAELEKNLSKLTIEVSGGVAPGMEVRRDGVVVGQAAWGAAIPVDPGAHLIEVTAPGKKPWRQTVTVAPNGAKATVRISALMDESQVPAVSSVAIAPAQPAGSTAVPPAPPATPSGRGDAQRLVGLLTGVVGLAGIGVGAYFGFQAMSKDKKAEENCHLPPDDGTHCTGAGDTYNKEAMAANTSAIISFLAGGVVLVGGVVLYLTAPRDRPTSMSTTRWMLSPIAGDRTGGLQLRGIW